MLYSFLLYCNCSITAIASSWYQFNTFTSLLFVMLILFVDLFWYAILKPRYYAFLQSRNDQVFNKCKVSYHPFFFFKCVNVDIRSLDQINNLKSSGVKHLILKCLTSHERAINVAAATWRSWMQRQRASAKGMVLYNPDLAPCWFSLWKIYYWQQFLSYLSPALS